MTNPCRGLDDSGTLEAACDSGALSPIVNKFSWQRPLQHIAFIRLTVANGFRGIWAEHVCAQVAMAERSALTEQRARSGSALYIAAAHVVGARTCNALLEVMANDEERLLRLIVELTDVEGVLDVQVLRCAPGDTRGFGEIGQGSV